LQVAAIKLIAIDAFGLSSLIGLFYRSIGLKGIKAAYIVVFCCKL